ncbi:hypothetical protein IFM89_027003 [Coptis chinensis]|uniref:Uncharacterized protein n=1 Tax=Coptis chinensis TaxID=261450 RepID=A0A835LXE9_9MAGN|nr:hypothetical protein IFM89_027003 [Coptis chinensis]
MRISNIYGLVLGEDRLFANVVLLRLADAFKSGDKHTRLCKSINFHWAFFSEVVVDFAYIFLEVLINMVSSSKTSITVKLACVKAFAKLGISFTLAKVWNILNLNML